MSLVLDDWIQKLADARSKAEMADVLFAMPLWTLTVYHDNIIRRLNVKGFPQAVAYVETARRLIISARPASAALTEAHERAVTAIEDVLAEIDAVDQVARDAIEAELSAIGL